MNIPNHQRRTEHEEVDLLLPWFVNETLVNSERERVAAHIDRCAECQESLGVLQSMQAVAESDAAIPIVPAADASKLMEKIGGKVRSQWNSSFWGLAIAASIALVLLGGMRFFSASNIETTNQFELATSDDTAAMDYVLAVEFLPGLSEDQRLQVFSGVAEAEMGAEIRPNTYRVMVRLPQSTLEQLEAFSNDLSRREYVQSVDLLALQLPVR